MGEFVPNENCDHPDQGCVLVSHCMASTELGGLLAHALAGESNTEPESMRLALVNFKCRSGAAMEVRRQIQEYLAKKNT